MVEAEEKGKLLMGKERYVYEGRFTRNMLYSIGPTPSQDARGATGAFVTVQISTVVVLSRVYRRSKKSNERWTIIRAENESCFNWIDPHFICGFRPFSGDSIGD